MNAYAAVICSMNADGYSDQQIADKLGVEIAEVTETLDAPHASQQPAPEADPDDKAAPPTAADGETAGDLLAWGEQHQDAAVRKHAQQAREALAALGNRRAVEAELARIHDEASRIEQRLQALREREASLTPKPKASRKKPRDYNPAEVRAWARAHGYQVSDRSRLPNDVLTAWRNRHSPLQAVS